MKLHCIDIGIGIPIVFQHGLSSDSRQIQKLFYGINDYRVICFDCPGHGQSLLENETTPSFDFYANLIINELDKLGISSAIFGGLSMGAGLALNISLRFPERVKALLLHRPAWLDDKNPSNLNILNLALKYMDKVNGKQEFETSQPYMLLHKELPLAANSVLGIFSDHQQHSLPQVIDSMVMSTPFSSIESLKEVEVPSLILGNDNDPLHPFRMAEIIHKNITDSTLYKITSRYINPILHRDEVQSHILKFIKNTIK